MDERRTNEQLGQLADKLLGWYDGAARQLPWRENTDPYRVWVSEIMLQQTRVEAVIPYYLRFLAALPTVQALAAAPREQLMKLWEGLGYYRRAENLQKAAMVVPQQYGGVFPPSYQQLLELPGVGAYTAGAVASICFGKRTPAVDGNVLRVLARLREDDSDIAAPATKTAVRTLLAELYPVERPGDFTQSLMELGATVCLPQNPRCGDCPVADLCLAWERGTQNTLPVKAAKAPRPVEQRTVLLLCCQGRVAVERRPPTGLLAGLWQFPNLEGTLTEVQVRDWLADQGLGCMALHPGPTKKHIFTHRVWEMTSYRVECERMADCFVWVTPEQLRQELTLPSAFQPFCSVL